MAEQENQETGDVNWDEANAFWNGKEVGGVEQGEEEEEEEPEQQEEQGDGLVDVRIKGRTVRMTPDDAAAYDQLLSEVRERDGRLGGELSQLRERLARQEGMLTGLQKPTEVEMPAPPPAKLAMEDWEEYHRQWVSYNARMMTLQREDLEGRYNEAEERRTRVATESDRNVAWAQRFYNDYSHLDAPELKGIVRDVYTEYRSEVDGLGTVQDQHARLAELAEQRILAIKRAGKPGSTERPPQVEGAGRPRSPGRTKPVADKPMTGEDWMRRKRAQLRGEQVS